MKMSVEDKFAMVVAFLLMLSLQGQFLGFYDLLSFTDLAGENLQLAQTFLLVFSFAVTGAAFAMAFGLMTLVSNQRGNLSLVNACYLAGFVFVWFATPLFGLPPWVQWWIVGCGDAVVFLYMVSRLVGPATTVEA